MRPLVRSELVRASRRLHEAGWVANHDGNASVRVGRDRFLITPTATSKRDVDEASLVLIDGAGKVVEGNYKPPGETELHLAAYRARPDVDAVLHAHPPYATAFGAARVPLEPLCLPEAVVSLGRVPTAPFALPKTSLATDAVAQCAGLANQFLLPGNGVLALGPDLSLCHLRMELVEHLAKILHLARGLGGACALPAEAQKQLEAAHEKAFPRASPKG
jgi:L-fuculose-phosphate aldolase